MTTTRRAPSPRKPDAWDLWYPRVLRLGQDGVALTVGAWLLIRREHTVWELMIGAVCIGAIAASVFERVSGAFGPGPTGKP